MSEPTRDELREYGERVGHVEGAWNGETPAFYADESFIVHRAKPDGGLLGSRWRKIEPRGDAADILTVIALDPADDEGLTVRTDDYAGVPDTWTINGDGSPRVFWRTDRETGETTQEYVRVNTLTIPAEDLVTYYRREDEVHAVRDAAVAKIAQLESTLARLEAENE